MRARATGEILPVSRFRANPSTDPTFLSTASADVATHPKLARAAIIERGGERIGVLGVTPPDLANISSPGGVRVTGPAGATLVSPRTYDIDALAAHLQPTVDALKAAGCNKILLATQLQQIDNEKALARGLDGVDVIIAGGSGTIYVNDPANLLPGDSAAGAYPFLTTDKAGRTVAIVSTEGQCQYLGRLLVDFDADGNVLAAGGDTLPVTTARVEAVWGGGDPFAPGTRGAAVKAVTDVVGAVINAKDGLVLGRSGVFLEGRRTVVRQQESNLGNLSADANLWYARQYDPSVRVSLKNGGGIRNAIGSVDANGTPQPTRANQGVGKAAGDISRLDIEDSLKFNNALSLVTVTARQLKWLLEHGVAGSNGTGADRSTPGQFCQLGGVVVVVDLDRAPQTYSAAANVISSVNGGGRIRYVALLDDAGVPSEVLVSDGEVIDPDRTVRMVTLNFLANAGSAGSDFGGDSYPFPYINRLNGDPAYGRSDLSSPALTPPLPAGFPNRADFAAAGTEQDAFAEYLAAFHATLPFGLPETSSDLDRRIVQGQADSDGDGVGNGDETSLFVLGLDPDTANSPAQVRAIGRLMGLGRGEVVGNPSAFGLFTAPRADFRLDGLVLPLAADARVRLTLQSSPDLEAWTDEATVEEVRVDATQPTRFFRFRTEAVVP